MECVLIGERKEDESPNTSNTDKVNESNNKENGTNQKWIEE